MRFVNNIDSGFDMEKSARCLKESIDGESTAVLMYGTYAELAEKENFPNIANLFRCLVFAEKIHVKNHMSALRQPDYHATLHDYDVGSTFENLKKAIEGEIYECKKMYPKFLKEIKSEMDTDYGKVAMLSMQWSLKVEEKHAKILQQAFDCLKKGKDFDQGNLYTCQVCGNIETGKPTQTCSICGHDASFFELIK